MTITVRPISGKKEMKQFIKFRIDLYRKSPFAVPPLYIDDLTTLNPKKNPAFDFCEAQCFMAFDGKRAVGRICAIINHRANDVWQTKNARFGFIDFIDDIAVSKALLQTAEEWAKSKGMTHIHGPLGFTDLDQEGMLVEGFDQMGTMATIYNYPYYPEHIEKLGYVKDAEWIEQRIYKEGTDDIPEKHKRISEIVMKKYNLRIRKFKSTTEGRKAGFGEKLFNLLNDSYSHLYGFTPLTERQKAYYTKLYFSLLKIDFISLIVDEKDDLVAMGIAIPSMSDALRKAQGRLFPFGWFHLVKAMMFKNPVADLLLIAVRKDYQNKGVNALIFFDLIPIMINAGVVYAECHPELEDNTSVQSQWQYFKNEIHKRRRAYIKEL